MLLVHIISFLLFFQLSAAKAPPSKTSLINTHERRSIYSCYVGLRKETWGFNGSAICRYEPAIQSMLYCLYEDTHEKGYSNKTLEKGFEEMRQFCYTPKFLNMTDAEFYTSLDNGTYYIQDQPKAGINITYPIRLNTTLRKAYYDAYYGYYYNHDIPYYFGGIICAYFVGVMLLAGLIRFLNYTPIKKIMFQQKLVNYVRGYTTLPTLYEKHAEPFSYLKVITGYLPTRFETLVILGYLILHTIFMAYKYQYDPYHIIFAAHRAEVAHFVAYRSGILSFAHLPLIVLFAGRNNFLQLISGLKHTSFIVFHKWLGRMMFLDAIIHAAGFTNYYLYYKKWNTVRLRVYWKFGIAATCLAGMLIFFSIAAFRRHYYETFMALHIVFAALFLYTCWEHVTNFSGIEWIYAAIAIWGVDRIVRITRIALLGFPKADLQLVGSDLVRVTVKKPKKFWKAKPGQYVFVSFLRPLCFWQSHPFTVMDSCVNDRELVIVLKAKKGVTKLVRNFVERKGGKASMRLAIEGPYGSKSTAHRFDNVLLLAGGSGLPGPISHALELGKTTAASGKNFVQLVIAVRGLDMLNACKKELMALKGLNVQVHIYNSKQELASAEKISSNEVKNGETTAEKAPSSLSNSEKAPSESENTELPLSLNDTSISDLEFATFHVGRPNVEEILNESVNNSGSLAVVCCGPPIFVDTARNQTAKAVIRNPSRMIEYLEEYQAW
ncbi:Fre4p [Saccharomyces cerevisiae YJM1248]|nr:Fre4p [Saccharomyces cerevisiae YJM627]AJT17572.1 Fre4p [Saccharomyces cerevisiae YJM1248]AJT29060.1 Fre4p [Saccharomyces cerevisiae YJM1439]AJT30120.1 Fre4p [Saccharomyces cerevisiae YJM1447]CAD6488195.1 Y55_G0013130.mRNA.1.CDS.1 [Saccharomyces cerevisiae]